MDTTRKSMWLAAAIFGALLPSAILSSSPAPEGARRAAPVVDPSAIRSVVYKRPGALGQLRVVRASLADLVEDGGSVAIAYDIDAVERTVATSAYRRLPAWEVGVRMLLGEMGPDRLRSNELALAEAAAILQTVHNRLDAEVWNPDDRPRVKAWPGCGHAGTFQSCANPKQYLGLRGSRATQPTQAIRDADARRQAIDTAVLAYWLVSEGVIGDLTEGAVSFVHRCGGAAYGEPTNRCDRDDVVPDVDGATSSTGPLVLRGPGRFDTSTGRYRLVETSRVDHVTGDPRPPGPWLIGEDDAAASVVED